MNQPYSNTKATLAVAKASFRSITRSPSAIVFSLAFPIIFILVFGFIGNGSGVKVDVAVLKGTDTLSPVYKALKGSPIVHFVTDEDTAQIKTNMEKGRLDATIFIKKNIGQAPPFTVIIQYTKASEANGNIFRSVIAGILSAMNRPTIATPPPSVVDLHESTITGRVYRTIDFILPGQLGFSLLSSGVFGTAFVFLSLRVTLVIKRFFATPIQRYSIVLGEMISRIVFSLLGALFIIVIGHFAFKFTLVHGFITVVNMLVLSVIGLIVFMGFGFVVSGIAKNETSVPPIANIITLPQFLLSGTFFSISAFPAWLQPISNVLPLTHLNSAMRSVAFEGATLWDVHNEIGIMIIWMVVIYAIAIKTFKWE